jgi:hypothetical protein
MVMTKRDKGLKLAEILIRLKWLLLGLIILVGAVLLIWRSQIEPSPLLSRLLETFGVGLLPISSFILIYEYGIRREYQRMVRLEFEQSLKELARRCGECERFGLLSLSEAREVDRLVEPFKTARAGDTVSALGVALADLVFFETNEKILKAIESGCRVRLLYLDPDCDEAERHSTDECRAMGEVKDSIKAAESNWALDRKQISQAKLHLLEIRKYRARPKHFIMIQREGVYVGDYLQGRRGNRCPHFFFAPGSPIADKYVAHFEELWSHAVPA